jgi:nucleoside-diphosphate-sugar epimerase
MKVLLTGATGFIGRAILAELRAAQIDTVAVGRAVGRANPGLNVPFLVTDLLASTDLSALIRQTQPTHLLHLAWYAEHGKFWESPLNLRWLEATVRLVEAFCENGGQQVVLAGTCAEYDWQHGYCREDHTPLEPATFYGTAKDATRRLCMAVCAQHHIPCTWGRIFVPYGPGEAPARLVPALIAALRGERAPFGINANAYRDFLHVRDVAHAFVHLLTQTPGTRSGAVNICSGEPVRLSQIVTTLADLLGADPAPILNLPSQRPGEPPLVVGDNRQLTQLGWLPKFDLREGLKHTLGSTP